MHITKKTKIVATIGPSTESKAALKKLAQSGMNVIRLNMSHGDHAEHGARIENARAVSKELGVPLPVLLDLSGPKIRTGEYTTDRITITEGATLILTSEKIIGDAKRISISYPKLPEEVKKGSIIMLDDGKKKLVVDKVVGTNIHTTVLVGGELKSRRGVNVPGAYLSIPSITAKDKKDLEFGLAMGVDMIALSFVRRKEDVKQLRKLIEKAGKNTPIIVKIETQESIDNLDDILEEADGAMVARGDLAIEVPAELVPIYQKDIIARSNALGKPVITATQMLESMITSPVPTRAEVSDVANAIFDGTDAVMLSEESTLGKYPVEAVSMMARIASTVEESLETGGDEFRSIADTISRSVVETAEQVGATVIVALTESGSTPKLVARFKPEAPIIALTPNQSTVQTLALVSGVYPYQIAPIGSLDESIKIISAFLKKEKLVNPGDTIVVTSGLKYGVSGGTNMLFVITV